MRNLLLMLLFVLGWNMLKAQDGNNTMYFLSNLPQRARLNPSYQPEYNAVVGLPALSGIYVNYNNTSFAVDDLLKKRNFGLTDSVVIDINSLHKTLRKNNSILFNNENSLLTVGFRVNSWYATLDITEKNDFSLNFKKDLFTFLKDGNTPYIGKTFDLGGFGVNATLYNEIALGLSKKVNDKLTVGGRVKVLMGIANVDMTDSDMSVYTAADGQTIRLHSRQDIRVSAPLEYTLDGQFVEWDNLKFDDDKINARFLMNTKNLGFGLDLGAEYKLSERLHLQASLLDLGFIRWNDNVHRFSQNTTFDWQGADISDSMNENNPGYRDLNDAFDDLIDSLKHDFRLTDGQGSYMKMLQAKLYAGVTYELHRLVNIGGVFKGSLVDGKFHPSLTASANARFCRNVSASVSYTAMLNNYTSVGAGITAKAGPFQLYVVADNVLAVNYTSARTLSARFGINLLFGHKQKVDARRAKRKEEDKEKVKVEKKEVEADDPEKGGKDSEDGVIYF